MRRRAGALQRKIVARRKSRWNASVREGGRERERERVRTHTARCILSSFLLLGSTDAEGTFGVDVCTHIRRGNWKWRRRIKWSASKLIIEFVEIGNGQLSRVLLQRSNAVPASQSEDVCSCTLDWMFDLDTSLLNWPWLHLTRKQVCMMDSVKKILSFENFFSLSLSLTLSPFFTIRYAYDDFFFFFLSLAFFFLVSMLVQDSKPT